MEGVKQRRSYLQQFSFGRSHLGDVCKLPLQYDGLHFERDHANDGFLCRRPLRLDRRRQRQLRLAQSCLQRRHEQPRPEESQLQLGASTHATSCSSGLGPHIPLGNASSARGGAPALGKARRVPGRAVPAPGTWEEEESGASAAQRATAPALAIAASLPRCHVLKGRWELKGIF